MKSAYELAMERLEKEKPSSPPLTDEQKAQLAEIDKDYEAKVAQARVMADERLKKEPMHHHDIQKELQDEIERLESEKEAKKNEIRQQNSSHS